MTCPHPIVVDERDLLSNPDNPTWIRSCAICGLGYDRTVEVLWPLREQIRAKYRLPAWRSWEGDCGKC